MRSTTDAVQRCQALYDYARQNGLGPELEEVPLLLPLVADAAIRGQLAKLYAVYAMRRKDYQTAARYGELACGALPDDIEARTNCMVSLIQLTRWDDALCHAREGLARHRDSFACHDVTAEVLARLGRLEEARHHGTLSLTLKDRQSQAAATDLTKVPVPPFDPAQPERNIIAFSLFGAEDRYCQGAIANVVGCPYLYPGWTCRFYVDDSVPITIVRRLAAAGAQIMPVTGLPAETHGTMWRFLVADDPAVDRYLVRDADSVINTRERVAVDEWLTSLRHFHVMRDDALQSELVLAGMWGGVRGALPALRPAIITFAGDKSHARGRTADQVFLRDFLWPTIRQSVLTHDSQFRFGDRRDFPPVGHLPPGRVLGDWSIVDHFGRAPDQDPDVANAAANDAALVELDQRRRRDPVGPEALLDLARLFFQQGKLTLASLICESAARIDPDSPSPHQWLGTIATSLRRNEEALARFERACTLAPVDPHLAYNLAVVLQQSGKLDQALARYDQALRLLPRFPDALCNRANVLLALGRGDEALANLREALDIAPEHALAAFNAANILSDRGETEAALALYDRAARARPGYLDAISNRGALLLRAGRPAEARESFTAALTINAGHADALSGHAAASFVLGHTRTALAGYARAAAISPEDPRPIINQGIIFQHLERLAEADAAFRRALAMRPDDPAVLVNLASVRRRRGDTRSARACLEAALRLAPGMAPAMSNLAILLRETGARTDALYWARRAVAADPDFAAARWRLAMTTVPHLATTPEERQAGRAAFAHELTELERWFDAHPDAEDGVGDSRPFYLSYEEANNRPLLAQYGALCARLMERWWRRQVPPIRASAPEPRTAGRKQRVGIISAHFRDHSVWHALVKGWFHHLDRDRFEVHGFSVDPALIDDPETAAARASADGFTQGYRGFRQWVETILAYRPDVLIYPEIGMDHTTVRLASLRLAPLQAASWGHPDTTGLPTIDAYLSADAFEPPDAADDYTETLVRLPGLGCCYEPLPVAAVPPDLARLGLRTGSPILLCPGTAQKYGPEHDRVLVEIARRAGPCQFLFFRSHTAPELSDLLKARLVTAFSAAGLAFDQVGVFIPFQDRPHYHGLMRAADLCLDTLGFSGFNTALQAIECTLPIVAFEGRFPRGRLASGILRAIGLDELVARTPNDYVEIAVRLLAERSRLTAVREIISARRSVLFGDLRPVRALETWLLGSVS